MGTVGKCSVCQRGPFRLNHLYHHLRRVHSWNEEQIDEERAKYRQKRCFGVYQFQCDLCQNVYLTHRSWQRHRELFHFTGKAIEPPYVVCSGCQQKFENNSALAKHWNVEHTEQECAPGPSTAACPPIMIGE
ncbi:zinc finger, C2H2 type [Necator americanus]|uniref:Zinc finger, C2H2 type n=1 Tax=Necator americanus TaxID=51031 RepID=W2TWY5_NECAM|nr:zinc finger, C2H2 type [Necator americanus]ETN86323.1 zinc finger, C2H2 type [Necator americanus]